MSRGLIIRASEIGQYAYCARAWWLGRVQGLIPSNVQGLAFGRDFHVHHGRLVASVSLLRRCVLILVGLAALCLMLALALGGGR